ncbi:hypothetical protein CN884_12065 [Ochrobactrum sp. 30A/1000/2015]|nr:hypothetical protein CN884_12065 [Ochrobactrum sp. 30A/1000/2015]PJT37566.1 hypothetical protein CN883_16480 [Ochrobactrum sp. 27A/999/2015]PJT44194.1 hypothetical protein CN882_09900 [Ochrobactrum sp. 23A/997/2015]
MLSRSGIIVGIIRGNIGRSGITTSAIIGARTTDITVDHGGIHTAITDMTAGVITIGTTTAVGITSEEGIDIRALRRPFSYGVINALAPIYRDI